MKPQDIIEPINALRERFALLAERLADPAIYSRAGELKQVSREHRRLESLFAVYDDWVGALAEEVDAQELLASESDAELREMAELELDGLAERISAGEKAVRLALLPPDPNDGKNIIVEIHPAAGGDESALFAGDLLRLYQRYAEGRRWKLEVLDQTGSDLGGIKYVSFSLSGDEVYSRMKYESGVHRVQRIPVTESGGRIHTSTVTVSVLAEAEEVELDINQEDLRFDVFRSSGPGGQCVNTTDSAVRVTHIPTGIAVASQQEKSQHRNKEIALRILYARLLENKQREEAARQAADKRSQVGTGDRSERIRTYNYPQNRVTDHRYNVTSYALTTIMDGDLDSLLEPIMDADSERRFEALGTV